MTSAEVFLLPKGRAAPPFANLIAKLYDTNEDGTPKTELASVTNLILRFQATAFISWIWLINWKQASVTPLF